MPTKFQASSYIRLYRGFNIVTLCLVMTASLVGSSLFSSPHWLEGHNISPGIQVIGGPINMNSISFVPSLDDSLFSSPPVSNYPKCRPSRILPECEPSTVQAGVLLSPSQLLPVGNILSGEIPDFTEKVMYTVVIKVTKVHLVLPHNANLGSIQAMTSENDKVFSEAADTTADLSADTWLAYAKYTGNGYSNGKTFICCKISG